jgi:methyl-accepting chemotaxis protein
VLEVIAAPAASAPAAVPIPPIETPPRESGLTELRDIDGRVYTDSASEVLSATQPSTRLGYVAVRSTISVNPPGILTKLVGSDAIILIGNKSGGVWTDLTAVVSPPSIDLSRAGVSEYRTSAGEGRVGALAPIRGTPWTVWVEFPRHLVIARARTFLNGMLATGVVVILLGALIVRTMTRRLTVPMAELTGAAESIADGDYARRVRVERRDELGRLGVAFNAMAAEIEDGRRRLEAQVRDRTEALETLRATEATSRAIVELAFDCIISIDGEGIVTEFNPAAASVIPAPKQSAASSRR